MNQQIELQERQIDHLVRYCSHLVAGHATGDVETIVFGITCLGEMAKRSIQKSEPLEPTKDQLFAMVANLRDQMDKLNQRVIELEKLTE